MGYEAPELTKADILAELNKLMTCTTNKLTDTEVGRIDAAISSAGGAPLSMIDFWSDPLRVTLNNTPADETLSNVVIPDLGTYTIIAAYAMLRSAETNENSGSDNMLDVDTFIQVDKAAAGYINAIKMLTYEYSVMANKHENNFLEIISDIDISSRVANNATTNFKWTGVSCTAASLYIGGLRTGIRLIVS